MTGEPPEEFNILRQVFRGESSLGVGLQVLPVELLEVASDEDSRHGRRLQRIQVIDQLIHRLVEILASALVLDCHATRYKEVNPTLTLCRQSLSRNLEEPDVSQRYSEDCEEVIPEQLALGCLARGIGPLLRERHGVFPNSLLRHLDVVW